MAYTSLCLISHKTGIYAKNMIRIFNSAKLRNDVDQIVPQKWLLASRKGYFCLTKGHLNNSEEKVEIECPLIGSYF